MSKLRKSFILIEGGWKLFVETYSDAWLKVIPEKLGERVSVYISHPVP